MDLSKACSQLPILLDAAMVPNASHTTAMVVKSQPHGDGSRKLVSSQVVHSIKTFSAMITQWECAPITLPQKLSHLVIQLLKTHPVATLLARPSHLLTMLLTRKRQAPTTALVETSLPSRPTS
jgi:hypothetical protein